LGLGFDSDNFCFEVLEKYNPIYARKNPDFFGYALNNQVGQEEVSFFKRPDFVFRSGNHKRGFLG